MSELGKVLAAVGILLTAVGALLWSGVGRGWLGRLPGDFHYSNGRNGDDPAPTRIGNSTNWVQAAAGMRECLALRNDGSIWAWGYNDHGEPGDGTAHCLTNPVKIGSEYDWRSIAASQATSFAVKKNGTLWAWGFIDGKVETAPRQLDPGTNWEMVAAAEFALLALKSDGTIWWKAISSRHSQSFAQIGRDDDWKTVEVRWPSYFAGKQDGSRWECRMTNATNAPSPERLPSSFAACSGVPRVSLPGDAVLPRTTLFLPQTAVVLTEDGGLWTWGVRLRTQPGAARRGIGNFVALVARHWKPFGNIFTAKVDEKPVRLRELPEQVRHSFDAVTPELSGRKPTNSNQGN